MKKKSKKRNRDVSNPRPVQRVVLPLIVVNPNKILEALGYGDKLIQDPIDPFMFHFKR